MASYTALGDNKYKIFVELGYNELGKRIRKTKTVTAKTEGSLKRQINAFEKEVYSQPVASLDVSSIRFSELVDKWMKSYVEPNLATNTAITYRRYLPDLLAQFGKMKVNSMKKLHIVEYLNHLEEGKSAKNRLSVLQSIFRKAVDWDIIDRSPAENLKVKKKAAERDIYDEEYITYFFKQLEKIKERDRLILKLTYYASLRRGEVLGISYDNLDFINDTVTIERSLNYNSETKKTFCGPPKGHNGGGEIRTLKLPHEFMLELEKYYVKQLEVKNNCGSAWELLDGVDIFFRNRDLKWFNPVSYTNHWAKIRERLKLKNIPLHGLRHSSASYLISSGVSAKEVQERLGHSQVQTTFNTYVHTSKKDVSKTIEAFNDLK